MSVTKLHCHEKFIIINLFLLYGIFIPAGAQNTGDSEPQYTRRINWKSDPNTYRYSVEFEKLNNGVYVKYLQEYTFVSSFQGIFPAGDYRFRIIPHDILDRPAPGTQWVNIEIKQSKTAEVMTCSCDCPCSEKTVNINVDFITAEPETAEIESNAIIDEIPEILPEKKVIDKTNRFNIIGVSAGPSFTTPLYTLSVFGCWSPVRNMFLELGCDFGFKSKDNNIKNFKNVYPYAGLGLYLPFGHSGFGFYSSAGVSPIINSTSGIRKESELLLYYVTAGINLADFINISYTLKTSFNELNQKFLIGFIWRFY